MNSEKVDNDIEPPVELYGYHATNSFANDISMPYLSYFAVRLGASFEQIAWIQSLMNLLPNALQYFWGRVSDTKFVIENLNIINSKHVGINQIGRAHV